MEENKLEREENLLRKLTESFADINGEVKRERRIEVRVETDRLRGVLIYAKEQLHFKHFSHMSCVDWIEEKEFELVYILWSERDKTQLLIKTRTDRDDPLIPNIDYIWRQANTYEREIREMYGVVFNGLVGEQDFILEDWDEMPPMRRDFDTAEFVKDAFFERPGREDAQDVREAIIERSREEIPDFAKKYSRD